MEIKLERKDIEKIAGLVSKEIEANVESRSRVNAYYQATKEQAVSFAKQVYNQNFKRDLADAIQALVEKEKRNIIRMAAEEAMKEINKDGLARAAIYDAMIEAADRFCDNT